jgi:hypothetical protein
MSVTRQEHQTTLEAAQRKLRKKSNPNPKFVHQPEVFNLFDQPMAEMRLQHAALVSVVLDRIQPAVELATFTDLGDPWSNGSVRCNSKLHNHFWSLEQTLGKTLGPDGYFIAEEDGWLVMHAGEFLLENFLGDLFKRDFKHKDFVAGILAASSQQPNNELTGSPASIAEELFAKDVAALFRERGSHVPILKNNPDWRAASARKAVP